MKIEGKNPVRELLASNKSIDKVYCQDKTTDAEVRSFVSMAKSRHAKIMWVDKKTLDKLSQTGHHQGIIAECTDYQYADLDDVLNQKKDLLLILLDGLEDPHNLGSVIRVAECAGADAVIIPARHGALVNETVIRVSAGASAYVRVCKVTNLNSTIEKLKEHGVWVFGADMDGQDMHTANLKGSIAIVIGAEGDGISHHTRELCDQIISIPMNGKVNSLNASVSAGILVYEALRQRSDQ